MERGIDGLLADFARELDYFVMTRDRLGAVMEALHSALERVAANASDGVAIIETQHLRVAYMEELVGAQPVLEEWLRVRGSGEQLGAAAGMTAEQSARFRALSARRSSLATSLAAFEQLQALLHERLAGFSSRLDGQ